MDGWGLGQIPEADAIRAANTPFVDSLYQRYPHSQLMTCGEWVGLPSGQMGNSEVGHLNIGAGRIVYQELERINVAFRNGSFEANPKVETLISYCETKQKPLHLIGLLSDGGVHSHLDHLIPPQSFDYHLRNVAHIRRNFPRRTFLKLVIGLYQMLLNFI